MESQPTSSGTARNPGRNNVEESQDVRSSSPAGRNTDNREPSESSESSESNKKPFPWKRLRVHLPNVGRIIASWWPTRNITIALASLVLTVLGLWVAVNANKFAIWTSMKDYIEYCSDQGALKTADCRRASNATLPPPPKFWKELGHSMVKRASSAWGKSAFDDPEEVTKIYLAIAILLQVGIAMMFIILLSRYRQNLPKNKIS